MNILGETVLHEVPVQVTDPLDVYRDYSATHGELAVIPPGSCDHVTELEDVAHPGVGIREIVDADLARHVVPVVPREDKLHFSLGKLQQIKFL